MLFLVLYFPVLLGFTFCLILMIGGEDFNPHLNTFFRISQWNNTYIPYYIINRIYLVSMMIGELEYKETFVSDRTKNRDIPINLIFFVFVIGVPIIINNLLIGMTVDNVTELTEQATLKGLKSQIKILETRRPRGNV